MKWVLMEKGLILESLMCLMLGMVWVCLYMVKIAYFSVFSFIGVEMVFMGDLGSPRMKEEDDVQVWARMRPHVCTCGRMCVQSHKPKLVFDVSFEP